MKFMKLMLALVLVAGVLYAQDFEGYVKYKIESGDQPVMVDYYAKGNAVRMEPEAGKAAVILFKDGKMYMMIPQQKMYMVYDNELQKKMEQYKVREKSAEMEKPQKTGETKDILGHTAEKWIIDGPDYSAEVWAAEDLGNFVMLSSPMQKNNMPDWYKDIASQNFFPLLIISKDKSGTVKGRMEVVELQEKSLPDDMFEIPGDYRKLDMPMGNH